MRFIITVEVEVGHIEGKFAPRDEIEEQIIGAIEGADENTWEGSNGGVYETLSWDVSADAPAPRRRQGLRGTA